MSSECEGLGDIVSSVSSRRRLSAVNCVLGCLLAFEVLMADDAYIHFRDDYM